MARRAVAQELEGIDTYRASQAYLVLNSWRNFPHASRDRAAICRNYLAGSLSDLCWRLPDAGFLPEIPRMDPMAVCGQSHLRRPFVLCVECFGLRFRDFSSAPDLFSGSFLRTASLDRQKVAVHFGLRKRSSCSDTTPQCGQRGSIQFADCFGRRRCSYRLKLTQYSNFRLRDANQDLRAASSLRVSANSLGANHGQNAILFVVERENRKDSARGPSKIPSFRTHG